MIPRIVHQCWLNRPIAPDCKRWMRELRDMNPGVEFKLWTRDNIHELGFNPKKLPFENPVWNSDIIRLEAVHRFGGVYLDCDIECLKPIDKLFHYSFSVRQRDGLINNAVFGAVPEHPWIRWQIKMAPEYIPRRREWAVYLMSDAPREEYGVELIDPNWVYPFWHDSPEEERKPHPDSILVHHWKKSWM